MEAVATAVLSVLVLLECVEFRGGGVLLGLLAGNEERFGCCGGGRHRPFWRTFVCVCTWEEPGAGLRKDRGEESRMRIKLFVDV